MRRAPTAERGDDGGAMKMLPLRILVVEDDEGLATLLRRVLTREGHLVSVVHDGAAGVETFAKEGPHVCLVDGLLPKLTGFEVCKQMRAQMGEKVALILMSATFRVHSTRPQAFSDSGADLFISKPFVLGDLKARVLELGNRIRAARGEGSPGAASTLPRTRTASTAAPAAAAPPVEPRPRAPASVDLPPVRPSSGHRAAGAARPAVSVEGPFERSSHVVGALREVAHARFSGLLRLEHDGSWLELGFLDGVLVGARDNLRESRLGERLLREGRIQHEVLMRVNERVAQGERVAEALINLGVVDGLETLQLLTEQVRERLWRALVWRRGTLKLQPDVDIVQTLAVDTFDLLDELLAFSLNPAREPDAAAFALARGAESVIRTGDFEDGLVTFAEYRPQSPLPARLLAGDEPRVDVVANMAPTAAAEIYAMWFAGLVRTQSDAVLDGRTVPRPAERLTEGARLDPAAASRIAAMLLRVRGRDHYAAIGAARAASIDELRTLINDVDARTGPTSCTLDALGSARGVAKELWARLDEIRAVLLHGPARAQYDAQLAELALRAPRLSAGPAPAQVTQENDFLSGQVALRSGELIRARECFERASLAKPNDADFNAWLAWAAFLDGDEDFAVDLLETAHKLSPEALRPLFFLGLVATRRGNRALAQEHLKAAHARAPHDAEIKEALAAVR